MNPSQEPMAGQQSSAYQPGQGAPAAYSLSENTQAAPVQQHPAASGNTHDYSSMQGQSAPALPPRTSAANFGEDDPSGLHYTRDPHKLTAYLVPFPRPHLKHQAAEEKIPPRFLIYTPPAPPIGAPPQGEKEGRVQKLQRKWQGEVREAKTNQAKVTSWKGVKGRATKGIDWAMGQTKSSSLEFLNRIPSKTEEQPQDKHSEDGVEEAETTKKTVGLEELVLFYPSDVAKSQEEMREEFVNSMLRTKSKAQKDAILATGLIPVSFAVDLLLTLVWPFGGLAEIDTVWAVASMRGAKNARSVTKRINSSQPTDGSGAATGNTGTSGGSSGGITSKLTNMMSGHKSTDQQHGNEQQLKLTFMPSPRVEVMSKYLATECHRYDSKTFQSAGPAPTESDVVTAIGWAPSQTNGETRNWEDEQWELQEVKDDVKAVMHKGAREWDKWIKAYEKDPEKALKKG